MGDTFAAFEVFFVFSPKLGEDRKKKSLPKIEVFSPKLNEEQKKKVFADS